MEVFLFNFYEGQPILQIHENQMKEETKEKFFEFWDSIYKQLENPELSLSEFIELFDL
ncbi:MAG: hypothetical protein N3A69_10880 [Leptospiraceae bacterium]|nr:hypothetical protein [Leptospiraceae bacterium]